MRVKDMIAGFAALARALFAGSSGVGAAATAERLRQQQQSGDPVAEAARKAREQKKAAPKPKKV